MSSARSLTLLNRKGDTCRQIVRVDVIPARGETDEAGYYKPIPLLILFILAFSPQNRSPFGINLMVEKEMPLKHYGTWKK